MTPPPTIYITLKVAFQPKRVSGIAGAMACDSLEDHQEEGNGAKSQVSDKRREQLISRDVCEEVGVQRTKRSSVNYWQALKR